MGSLIGYAGLSHLGIVSAIATAAKGFDVVAHDSRPELIADLRAGKLHVHEPGLAELLQASTSRMTFTASVSDLSRCSVVVLSIDIPTDTDDHSDLSALDRLAEGVVAELGTGTALVILSQVRPGYTRALARRLQVTLARKQVQLYYQVETLIFGRAIERALQPERIMVGCADPARPLPPAYEQLLRPFSCPILPMRYESAELAKISINIFLAASVTATNMLAEICENVSADWFEIVPALKLDRRIGPYAYLAPGLGLGGGNLERDLATVKSLAAECGTDDRLIDAFRGNSVYRRDWVLRTLHSHLPAAERSPVVAVWGLAYKPETHSIKNSPALAFIASLPGLIVRGYDPQVKLAGIPGIDFLPCDDPLQACAGADALVVMTPWDEFRSVDPTAMSGQLRGRLVIDPFGCLDGRRVEQIGLTYLKLGTRVQEGTVAA